MLLNNGIITRSVIYARRGKSNGNLIRSRESYGRRLGKNDPNYKESVQVVTERADCNR